MAVSSHVRGRPHVLELRSIFSPLVLVVFLYVPLLLLYVVSSESIFATEFDSRKSLSWTGFAYFALALLCFAAGAKLGGDVRAIRRTHVSTGPKDEPGPTQRRSLAVLLEFALLVTIGAYLLWFGRGVVRAGGVAEFLDIWRNDPFRFKEDILATLPGITTLTQLGVAAIPLVFAFRLYGRGSILRIAVAAVIALGAVRAVLFSERLALIELVIPLVFVVAAPRRVTVPRVAVYAVALVLAVVTFFAATELRRSYAYTQDFSASRATTRFVGYYLTSVNNGVAIIDDHPAATPFYATGSFLWHFPVLGDLRAEDFPGVGTVSLRYPDLFGVDPGVFWPRVFVAENLDYEFNVFSAPGYLAADFGWAGLIGALALGLISGRLYRRSKEDLFHLALYAVWLVGLFEFMRIDYFTDTRVLPAYLLFGAAYLVLRRRARFRTAHAAGPTELVPTGRVAETH